MKRIIADMNSGGILVLFFLFLILIAPIWLPLFLATWPVGFIARKIFKVKIESSEYENTP